MTRPGAPWSDLLLLRSRALLPEYLAQRGNQVLCLQRLGNKSARAGQHRLLGLAHGLGGNQRRDGRAGCLAQQLPDERGDVRPCQFIIHQD